MNDQENYENKFEVDSTVVRAGRRTYFFNIKATKDDDLYLVITESKKSTNDGRAVFQKHKIFLYKEDFEKFSEALETSLQKIEDLKSSGKYKDSGESDYSSVDFDDLA